MKKFSIPESDESETFATVPPSTLSRGELRIHPGGSLTDRMQDRTYDAALGGRNMTMTGVTFTSDAVEFLSLSQSVAHSIKGLQFLRMRKLRLCGTCSSRALGLGSGLKPCKKERASVQVSCRRDSGRGHRPLPRRWSRQLTETLSMSNELDSSSGLLRRLPAPPVRARSLCSFGRSFNRRRSLTDSPS